MKFLAIKVKSRNNFCRFWIWYIRHLLVEEVSLDGKLHLHRRPPEGAGQPEDQPGDEHRTAAYELRGIVPRLGRSLASVPPEAGHRGWGGYRVRPVPRAGFGGHHKSVAGQEEWKCLHLQHQKGCCFFTTNLKETLNIH